MRIDENKKRFDCVEMKRRIQERIYEETKAMSTEEIIAYFHRRVQEGSFADLWRKDVPQAARTASRSSGR